ncbi:MAG: 2-C-methyl-D-erythritol 4-phosphate cytidylyltransferase [Bacteroidales bacterium]|jgi:2-C-methyl-D-erythritol 4-phosphate cytidylyltransferase|nr:2-C-methyl-D-erythritol 4-phosphate cytidylyltransferase [Bacteroidales bacterium]MDD3272913.1 2-C-methyl-D-erythritol 4-phosphate cytidylyltransferase [Bacteroidales bacterium]MDD4058301.1 2-C-methyl-D-erythritol 4-phosphate cytidylyltransferase [Bacteroidales bacterium]
MMERKRYAIIVAGGSGSRMGGDVAKQFMMLGDRPILLHTIENFFKLAKRPELIVVVPHTLRDQWKSICKEYKFTISHILVSGGITRFHSVKNALKYVNPGALVAVHDGVRPFASTQFIDSLYDEAEESGAVIPVLKVTDSLRIVDGINSKPVNRDDYVAVQTPQVFWSEYLLNGYEQAYSPEFTDDAAVVESTGVKIKFAVGLTANIKITKPEDMLLASAYLTSF